MSYQGKVYRKQGGDELVVASGGKITVEAGGYAMGGAVETGSTSTTGLSAYGLSLVLSGTSGTGTNTYQMQPPVPGVPKWITATLVRNSSDSVTITGQTTTVTFGSTLMPKLVFTSAGTAALIGRTTAIWDVVNVGSTVTPAPLLALTS
jgi:hypothetical protein